jgi:hypothetical protein
MADIWWRFLLHYAADIHRVCNMFATITLRKLRKGSLIAKNNFFFPKVFWENQFWTFIFVHFPKRERLCQKKEAATA